VGVLAVAGGLPAEDPDSDGEVEQEPEERKEGDQVEELQSVTSGYESGWIL
jgi:hypothetical protein